MGYASDPKRVPVACLGRRYSHVPTVVSHRIYAARRAAVLSRLTQERRLSAERAEALVVAWEAEGDARGLDRMTAGFWDDGDLDMSLISVPGSLIIG